MHDWLSIATDKTSSGSTPRHLLRSTRHSSWTQGHPRRRRRTRPRNRHSPDTTRTTGAPRSADSCHLRSSRSSPTTRPQQSRLRSGSRRCSRSHLCSRSSRCRSRRTDPRLPECCPPPTDSRVQRPTSPTKTALCTTKRGRPRSIRLPRQPLSRLQFVRCAIAASRSGAPRDRLKHYEPRLWEEASRLLPSIGDRGRRDG